MTTATTTKTITLTDLALAVNRLIDECPDRCNPSVGNDCVYYDELTDARCLIGQALYDLTGCNVHPSYEGQSIDALLSSDEFRRSFGLAVGDNFGLEMAIVDAQSLADGKCAWGILDKINVDDR